MHHIIKLWERVNVMTIADAIKKVLEKYPEGLTDKAIYEKIIENGYYEFGAQEPIKVVAVELKRHCEGQTISNASSNKCFVVELNENKKLYKLKYVRGQVMGETKKYACSTAVINGVAIYTFTMTVQDLANISYVAVRGVDEEEGAVQRVLNKQRINAIKNYVLDDNMFVNTFVLNWTYKSSLPVVENDEIILPILFESAQLIDGQHRLEGLKLALQEKPDIANNCVIVSMAINLETKEAAKIFLNINSEQKPVPKSLIYDLYGVTDEDRNYSYNRAQDIASTLNDDPDSAFYNVIKKPGTPRGKGKLDLSTVVNALKEYVDHDGKLEENNIKTLNVQAAVLNNYFSALKYHADKTGKWSTISQNIFYKAAGFIGAITFFMEYVLPKCVSAKSFKQEVISQMFDFASVDMITPKDIETTDGRTARKRVIDNLKSAFISDAPGEMDYDI